MRWIVLLSLAATTATGCQSYERRPLDGRASLQEWRDRTPMSQPLRTFAETYTVRGDADSPVVFDPADGIDLIEAEVIALFFNAELRKARLESEVAVAGAAEAGRWDDPRIAVDVERLLEGAGNTWVLANMLQFTIPISGRLDIEKRLAAAEVDVRMLEAAVAERRIVALLRQTWLTWSAAVERERVLAAAIDDLNAIGESAGKLAAAGEIDSTDARLFAIDHVQLRGDLLASRREQRRGEAEIRQLLGLSPHAPLTLKPSLPINHDEPLPDDPDEGHPVVALARARYEQAERSLELEIRRQYPDIELGGGLGSEYGDANLLAGVSLPLPILNANRRAVAEARVRRDAARAEYESRLQDIAAGLARQRAELADTRETLALVEGELLPLVNEQVADTRKLLDAGEFNPLVLRDAIDAAARTKLQIIDARLSVARTIVELKYLTETSANHAKSVESQP